LINAGAAGLVSAGVGWAPADVRFGSTLFVAWGFRAVDPEAVRSIAGVVGAAAGEFPRGYASRSAGLAPAGGRDGGWSAAGAARSAVAGWEGLVRRLGTGAAVLGSDLSAAVAEHEATDREAAVVIATTAPGARVVQPE
jgi:hypothetical protein